MSEPVTYFDIVFDGPPSHEAPRFVECENEQGASISVGEWVHRPDGYGPSFNEALEAAIRGAKE